MDVGTLLEGDLDLAVARSAGEACPPRLAEALRYAVFPGGARIRPRLTLAVANACGNKNASAAITSASAIELLHCASLVHDDLPCFDNSALRRGKPSVHAAFGERIAVLTGDALIVLAFEWLAVRLALAPDRLAPLTRIIASCVGGPSGICAGQAWECEQTIDIVRYQRAKTGALFAACTMAGAASSGYEPSPGSSSVSPSAKPSRWLTTSATSQAPGIARQAGAPGRGQPAPEFRCRTWV